MQITERLSKEESAQGVILGGTELGLTTLTETCSIPMFDTTRLHSIAAVNWALR